MKTTVKHLLVDLDGTLLGNHPVSLSLDFVRQAFMILRKFGGLRWAAWTAYAVQGAFSRPSEGRTNAVRAIEIFARKTGLPFEETRSLIRESLFRIFPTLQKHFYPIDGAKDFLEWASGRYTLTLATNPVWPKEIIEMRVRWAGIDPGIFESITHVNAMHACKPELAYYKEILSNQGFSAKDCMLIGNDLKMDLPATRAGVRVFIIDQAKKRSTLTPSGCTPLKHPQAKAKAWKGTYADLQKLLET